MFSRNKEQKVFDKEIDELLMNIHRNNEKISHIIVSLPIHQLDKISLHQQLTSATTSNEIEGIVVISTNSVIVNQLNQTFIDNYMNALSYIMKNYQSMKLTSDEILANHRTLFANTNFPFGGKWKSISNNVVDATSRQIIAKTISPEETATTIGELVHWYETDDSLPSLIKDCIFIYDFLKIHPFEDGNGRVSRLLTNLLFLKNGCEFLKYSSLEEQINKNVKEYYASLRTTTLEAWFNDSVDYTKWIQFNLQAILNSQNKFLEMANLKEVLLQIHNKALIIAKWFDLNINHEFTKKELEVALELYDISSDTIKKVLPKLIHHQFITKKGTTNRVSYVRTLNNQTIINFNDMTPILNPGKSKKAK